MFAANEILEMAIKVEENGERFYRFLSDSSKEPEKREFFNYMALQEKDHAKTFREIGTALQVEEVDYIDVDEVDAYLKSYVDGRIFPSVDEMLEKVRGKDIEEVIDYAIGLEKDSIIFYYQIMEVIKSDRARKLVKAVIEQEKQHVLKLLEIKGE